MNFRGGQSHRAANVRNLNPCPVEIARPFKLGHHADGALLHDLRNKFVRVEQVAAHGGKEAARFRLTRIVRDIGDVDPRLTAHTSIDYPRDIINRDYLG